MFRNLSHRLNRVETRFKPKCPPLDIEILFVNTAHEVVSTLRVEDRQQAWTRLPEPVTVEAYMSMADGDSQVN